GEQGKAQEKRRDGAAGKRGDRPAETGESHGLACADGDGDLEHYGDAQIDPVHVVSLNRDQGAGQRSRGRYAAEGLVAHDDGWYGGDAQDIARVMLRRAVCAAVSTGIKRLAGFF